MKDVNVRENVVRDILEFCTTVATLPDLKLFQNKVYLNKQTKNKPWLQSNKIRSI